MSQMPTPSVQTAQPRENPPAAKPSATAILLNVIRTIIEIGLDRLAELRSNPNPEETHTIASAARVEARGPDAPPPPKRAPASPRPPRRPAVLGLTDAEDTDVLLARLPTDWEIACMVRNRRIGAVLVDICADFGIGYDHPIWHEICGIIVAHGGQICDVLTRTFFRLYDAHLDPERFLSEIYVFRLTPQQMRAATGPPPRSQAA